MNSRLATSFVCRLLTVVLVMTTYVSASFAQPAEPQPARKKPKAAKTERYAASVPKPTIAGARYGDHERHIIDFWKAESSTPTPLVFVIHGGGWQGGSKERVQRFADVAALLKAGISVTALNYRYVRQGVDAGINPPVKAPLHDAARALQFVRSKAKEWNIDKERIGAAGGSAGACSSLWLAFHDDLANSKSADPVARESTRLRCAAVIGAQTTLDPKQMKEWTPNSKYGGHAFGIFGFSKFLAERKNILPWIAEYSPYALVTKDDPPVYLIYSAPPALGKDQRDPTHTSNFGVKLQEHCKAIGVACELVYPKAPKVKHASPTEYLINTLKAKTLANAKATSNHLKRNIEGWTVLISNQLWEKEKTATARALELLTVQLREITLVVPKTAVVELKKVPLWFSPQYPGVRQRAEYHPGVDWLRKNNRDPRMAKAVEFTNIRIFERETKRMPNFALHELAHAYHDRVLPKGFGNVEIKSAFEHAKEKGLYEKVERRFGDGRSTKERSYAMTNPMEYFAECTEGYFSRNDFFPFTRKDLEKHDPKMFSLLATLWSRTD
jgi:acetyl esterase/lipase